MVVGTAVFRIQGDEAHCTDCTHQQPAEPTPPSHPSIMLVWLFIEERQRENPHF